MKFTYTADDGTTFDTADECKQYEAGLRKSEERGWPNELVPDKENEWVETFERLEIIINKLTNQLWGISGQPAADIERRLKEAKEIREAIVGKLGYTPRTSIDDDLEDLRQSMNDGTSALSHLPNDAWVGPRGGIYRRNKSGGKSYI